MTKEEIIRTYYSGWEKKQWSAVDNLLADGFTFTSPNDEDHIDKRASKQNAGRKRTGLNASIWRA